MSNVNLYFFDLSKSDPIGWQLASLGLNGVLVEECAMYDKAILAPTSNVQVYAQSWGAVCCCGHDVMQSPEICDQGRQVR